MANIRTYLAELEARLAPSLPVQALQERLTEAEGHLRDRAQEFLEIGLPAHEAEMRAVAEFGDTDEYVADIPPPVFVPPAFVPPVPVEEKVESPKMRWNLPLQLCFSVLLVAGLATFMMDWLFVLSGFGLCVTIIFISSALGNVIRRRWLFAMALFSSIALYGIFVSSYYPTKSLTPLSPQDVQFRFLNADKAEVRSYNRFLELKMDSESGHFYSGYEKPIAPTSKGQLIQVETTKKAAELWARNGEAGAQALRRRALDSIGVIDEVSSYAAINQFRSFAAALCLAFLGFLLGFQALGLMINGLAKRITQAAKRASKPTPPAGYWDVPRR